VQEELPEDRKPLVPLAQIHQLYQLHLQVEPKVQSLVVEVMDLLEVQEVEPEEVPEDTQVEQEILLP
tara:strand:- start:358 stop:558 length:201 start_codon:yes stop_codon:yes gene_type:complete